jgi:hypothetical protein
MKKPIIKGTTNRTYLNWLTRMAKREADSLVFRCLASWALTEGKKRILTLPGAEWLWEREFLQYYPDYPIEFLGLESNSRIAKRMRDAVAFSPAPRPHKFNPHPQNLSFEDYAESFKPKDGAFDMIYLDWRGAWGEDKLNQLRLLFLRGMLKAGGYFRFTVCLTPGKLSRAEHFDDEQQSFHFGDILGGGDRNSKWQAHGVPAIAIAVARKEGYHMEPVAMQYYQSYPDVDDTLSQTSFLFRLKS